MSTHSNVNRNTRASLVVSHDSLMEVVIFRNGETKANTTS